MALRLLESLRRCPPRGVEQPREVLDSLWQGRDQPNVRAAKEVLGHEYSTMACQHDAPTHGQGLNRVAHAMHNGELIG